MRTPFEARIFACTLGGALLVALLAIGPWAAAVAQEPSPADAKLLSGYALSMDKLRHYDTADKALYADAAKDATLKAEIDKMSDEEPQVTLADIEAKLTRHPRVAAYYTKEGLSNEDAVVLPVATMMAMTAAQGKGVTPASQDQVAFAKAHEKEIQTMLEAWFKDENDQD